MASGRQGLHRQRRRRDALPFQRLSFFKTKHPPKKKPRLIRGFFVPEIRATPNPVGARLAREGVITDAKSFVGKPRSYRSVVFRAFWFLAGRSPTPQTAAGTNTGSTHIRSRGHPPDAPTAPRLSRQTRTSSRRTPRQSSRHCRAPIPARTPRWRKTPRTG